MIYHRYGEFNDKQIDEYKKELHKRIHWLLLYKDPNVDINAEDFQSYFHWTMKEIAGLNSLLQFPSSIVHLLVLLQSARLESYKAEDGYNGDEVFDFNVYRKFILDAHKCLDRLGGDSSDNRQDV